MGRGNLDFTFIAPAAVISMLAICTAGCWEEIVYTGPEPAVARREAAPPAAGPAEAEEPAPPPDTAVSPERVEISPATEAEVGQDDDEPINGLPFGDWEGAEPEETPTAEVPSAEMQDEPDSLFGAVEEPAAPTQTATDTDASRQAAWQLGSKLSLAALAHDRGLVPESVNGWFQEARSAAEALGTSVDKLPERAESADEASAAHSVHEYLYQQGQRVWRDLSERHGADHAALFEMAVKSNVLQILYAPGSADSATLAKGLSEAGAQARLPQELWQPLLDVIARQAPGAEVRAAVRKLHADVDQHLGAAREQSR